MRQKPGNLSSHKMGALREPLPLLTADFYRLSLRLLGLHRRHSKDLGHRRHSGKGCATSAVTRAMQPQNANNRSNSELAGFDKSDRKGICVRDVSWHPSAPVFVATGILGWGGGGSRWGIR